MTDIRHTLTVFIVALMTVWSTPADARQPLAVTVAGQQLQGVFAVDGAAWAPVTAASRAFGVELTPAENAFKIGNTSRTAPSRTDNGQQTVNIIKLAENLNAEAVWNGTKLDIYARVTDLRFSEGRLKIATSLPVSYKANQLTGPERIYVDIPGARIIGSPAESKSERSSIRALRIAQYNADTVRVVAETATRLRYVVESPAKTKAIVLAIATSQTAPAQVPPLASNPLPATGPTQLQTDVVTIQSIRLIEAENSVQFVITANKPPEPQSGMDSYQSRLWLEFDAAVLTEAHPGFTPRGPMLQAARVEQLTAGVPRIRLIVQSPRILSSNIKSGENSNQIIWELTPPEGASGDWRKKTILIDPGHGGSDPGAQANNLREKDLNLSISRATAAEARKRGLNVVMTRETDVTLSLRERTDMITKYGAAVFVSIHNNSTPRANSATGTEVFYHRNDASSRALAQVVHDNIVRSTGMSARGAKSDSTIGRTGVGLFVLRNSPVPAILIEVGFVNHTRDAARLRDSAFQQQVAEAIVDGLIHYLGGLPETGVKTTDISEESDSQDSSSVEKQ